MVDLRVGIVGCGLIGGRRAEEANRHPQTRCIVVADNQPAAAARVAQQYGARTVTDWRHVVSSEDVDVVCIATPNGLLAEIAIAALESGKHVLIEKPMGRNVGEALAIADAAQRSGRKVKVGFNHRYHPAIVRAHDAIAAGMLGAPVNARVRYGHGGRPGYEREWRGNAELAGGGELTDQGVHVVDLLHWFLGVPNQVYAVTQRAVWSLGDLEDNGFAILQYPSGVVAAFHTSWTQWKNLFSTELFCERGSLVVEGLGGSYGPESLVIARRAIEGGAPHLERIEFEGPDLSWQAEWDDFVHGLIEDAPYMGDPYDGLVAMRTLACLYRSAAAGRPANYPQP